MKWNGENLKEMYDFLKEAVYVEESGNKLFIYDDDLIIADIGDDILKNVDGFYRKKKVI